MNEDIYEKLNYIKENVSDRAYFLIESSLHDILPDILTPPEDIDIVRYDFISAVYSVVESNVSMSPVPAHSLSNAIRHALDVSEHSDYVTQELSGLADLLRKRV